MRQHQLNPVVESVIAGIIGLAIGAAIMLGYGYRSEEHTSELQSQ